MFGIYGPSMENFMRSYVMWKKSAALWAKNSVHCQKCSFEFRHRLCLTLAGFWFGSTLQLHILSLSTHPSGGCWSCLWYIHFGECAPKIGSVLGGCCGVWINFNKSLIVTLLSHVRTTTNAKMRKNVRTTTNARKRRVCAPCLYSNRAWSLGLLLLHVGFKLGGITSSFMICSVKVIIRFKWDVFR